MRCCLSSSMIGVPQVAQVHSSRGPLGFWSLNGWRFKSLGLSTFTSPCLKNTTWDESWPVTRLQTEQWQVWLSSGSASEWVCTCSHPPAYLWGMFSSLASLSDLFESFGSSQNHHGSDALARVSATSLTKISVQSRRQINGDRKSTRLNSSH